MSEHSAVVDAYMNELEHPLKETIDDLRRAVLSSVDGITERIKWNAPSFCADGVDRVTFMLRSPERIQVIFHRGAKVRADAREFVFTDDTGLLTMITPDRGAVTFAGPEDARAKRDAFVLLVARWMSS